MNPDHSGSAAVSTEQEADAERSFDVFLSYHWADRPVVEPIARVMRDRELKVFLDRWYLAPGRPWPQALEDALGCCGAVAVFVGPHGMGAWQQREYYLALDRQARESEFPVIPVLMPGSDPALGFLSLNTWIDLREAPNDPVVIEQLINATRRLSDRVAIPEIAICPYRGLRPFREEDASFFFGREAFTRRVVETVERSSLVALVGVSGSGKSSVVRAGLVPHLRRGGGGHVWEIATMVPTDRPLHRLAAVLIPRLEPDLDEVERVTQVTELAERLLAGTVSLRAVVERVLEKQPGTDRMLLVVDQWEEIYTLCHDAAVRERFIELMLEASRRGPLTLVLTTRADFFDDLLEHRALGDALQGAVVNLGPMTREELTQAIEAPAHRVGLSFEPGLVERIQNDVSAEPGSLPLLEFVLTELWERRRKGRLVHDAYEAMGGAQGAIAQRAEQEFERLTETERNALPTIFLQLVRPGDGTGDTRRRAKLSDLGEGAGPVVQRLTDARLLVTGLDAASGEETVEVAHEALIRNWGRLQEWLDADREFLLWRQRLRSALAEWERTGLDSGALLRGAPLGEARRWFERRAADLPRIERSFIEECFRDQRSRRRRQRIGLATLALAVVVVGALFLWQRTAASDRLWTAAIVSRAETESDRLTATLLLTELLDRRGSLSLRELLQGRSPEPAGGMAVARRLADDGPALVPWAVLRSDSGAITFAAFSSDSTVVATDERGAVWTWPLDGRGSASVVRGERRVLAVSPDGSRMLTDRAVTISGTRPASGGISIGGLGFGLSAAAFSPDGSRVVLVADDGTARLYSAEEGSELDPLGVEVPGVSSVQFSPDGGQLAILFEDRAALWRMGDPELPLALHGHQGRVLSVAFGTGDSLAVTTSDDSTALVWRVSGTDSPSILGSLVGHQERVWSAAFSPGDSLLATVSEDSTARLWRLHPEEPPHPVLVLRGHGAGVRGVGFSPDGSMLLTRSADGLVRVWRIAGRREDPVLLRGHQDPVWSVAFSPDGARVLSASLDYTARVWRRIPGGGWETGDSVVAEGAIRSAAFAPEGSSVAAAYASERTVTVCARSDLQECRAALTYGGRIERVAFSPDGAWLTATSSDSVVQLWRSDGSGRTDTLGSHGDRVLSAGFSSGGKRPRLLTASADGTARVWDLEQPGSVDTLRGHRREVYSAVFNPAGTRVVTASDDSTARIWRTDRYAARETDQLSHPSGVRHAIFGRDGVQVATADRDGTLRIWTPGPGGMVPFPLGRHEREITSLEFSPDGRYLLTASADSTARIWRTDGLGAPAVLRVGESVRQATFSPTDARVATAAADGTVRIWLVDWAGLLSYLRESTSVCLRPEERQRLLNESRKDAREKFLRCENQRRDPPP